MSGETKATRQSSQSVLRAATKMLPELVGGSADLAGSTGTVTGQRAVTAEDFSGSVIHFGIREFAMAAILNGLSLHGGFRCYGSTFLVFSDYLRPALRLSALMRQPVVYVLTHDSVAVGEDWGTHQPVEHLESLLRSRACGCCAPPTTTRRQRHGVLRWSGPTGRPCWCSPVRMSRPCRRPTTPDS